MDDIAQKVQARFAELPPDVRQAVEAADLDARIQTIGTKHHLHIDQTGKLQNEVLLVMLAFEDSATFVNNLTNLVGLSHEQASAVATDINNEIFGPIRESLKKFAEQAATAPAPTPTPPAASAPPPAPVAVTPTKPAPPPTVAPKPPVPLAPHPHDLMLVEKTVTTPATPPKNPAPPTTPTPGGGAPQPPKPEGYKADPYREPPE